MNVHKFVAHNAREALRKVKETLGNDAVILSNRAVPEGVEIVAVAQKELGAVPSITSKKNSDFSAVSPKRIAVTDDEGAELKDYASVMASTRAKNPFHNASVLKLGENKNEKTLGQSQLPSMERILESTALRLTAQPQKKEASTVAWNDFPLKSTVNPKKVLKHKPESPEDKTKKEEEARHGEVMAEIKALRAVLDQQLAGFAWGFSAQNNPMQNEMLAWMLNVGFSPQFSRDLLKTMPLMHHRSEAVSWVQSAADSVLQVADEANDLISQGGVFALVGPTGVGKTTTAAKLAARAVLQHGADKVALITTDNYRIGAHEQLRIYGRILGVVVFLAKDTRDLEQTLLELRHKHLVLIDTMGMSQRDKMVGELNKMLSFNQVKRVMLLNATAQSATLDDVVRAYGGEQLSGCILTKTDEAFGVAGALDVIMRHKMRLCYISNGQRVPEDLHLPNRGYLLHRAFKNIPLDSPHHLEGLEPAYKLGQARG